MIHAAIMGSLERFLSIYLEHIYGMFPLWLAPVQVALLPVADPHMEYATSVVTQLQQQGIRVEIMDPSDSLGKRIRVGEKQRIPYLLVIGDEEVNGNSLAVRNVVTKEQVSVGKDEFISGVVDDRDNRALELRFGK